MPAVEVRGIAPAPERARRTGRGLFWAMLAALVVLLGAAVVAMLGWNTAIHRADEQTARAVALQAAADQATGLKENVAALQKNLADARTREDALQTELAGSKATAADARNEAKAADSRVAAADKAASDAGQARVEAKVASPPAIAPAPELRPGPQSASNISAATVQSDIAPGLPLPGLPPGATARDYLVAAQQAVREGRTGRAQAALEHAETRMLNQASLSRTPGHPASHPGVTDAEHALDQLGNSDTEGALHTIDELLTNR